MLDNREIEAFCHKNFPYPLVQLDTGEPLRLLDLAYVGFAPHDLAGKRGGKSDVGLGFCHLVHRVSHFEHGRFLSGTDIVDAFELQASDKRIYDVVDVDEVPCLRAVTIDSNRFVLWYKPAERVNHPVPIWSIDVEQARNKAAAKLFRLQLALAVLVRRAAFVRFAAELCFPGNRRGRPEIHFRTLLFRSLEDNL